jgi:hypothetical protein
MKGYLALLEDERRVRGNAIHAAQMAQIAFRKMLRNIAGWASGRQQKSPDA